MGGTGLEPVTPSLSSRCDGDNDLHLSPIFPAQHALPHTFKKMSLSTPSTVCALFVRRKDCHGLDAHAQARAHTLDQSHRLFSR
jgi:hypothetical protein